MPTNEDLQQWHRRRMVCCLVWGCAPWEFDAAWEAGKISLSDVNLAVDVATVMSPEKDVFLDWMTPGIVEEIRAREKERAEREAMERSWAGLMNMTEVAGER